ncbi:hypothetical protein HK102_010199, partial [Quaeritorhiza haematococci]
MRQAGESLRKFDATAKEARSGLEHLAALASDVRDGKGSLGKLIRDDSVYDNLVALTKRGEKAVETLDDDLMAIKQTWPISRYFESRAYYERDRVLYRPGSSRESRSLRAEELFEPGRAALTPVGKTRLDEVARWFQKTSRQKSEVVIAAFPDPQLDPALAAPLPQEQAGWFRKRKVAAVGFGGQAPRLAENVDPAPARRVEIILIPRAEPRRSIPVASLFVIQGADQGKRFEFQASPVSLGRDNSNAVRLHDTEVSRRHAEIRLDDDLYRVFDLGSANGTYVNGHLVDQAPLRTGDRLQLGQTVMLYNEGPLGARRDLTARVDLLAKSSPEDRSAILRSIPSDEGSRVLQQPDGAAGWLRERLMSLSVMYRATQAVSHILDVDSLLPQVLELVFESIGADRGAILLRDESGVLVPKAVRWRSNVDADERMTISSTITDYVLEQGQGVITTDAPGDTRFGPAESILDLRIREAICVPVQGRHTTLGVLYADIQADGSALIPMGRPGRNGKFSQDHLMLMVAIGHQAGLAIENTTFYNDKIQAERLAAVGQTIATLSHHIKNILQGVRGG